MRKRRRFYRGVVNHVYQRTVSGCNLFYGDEDFLTFFTIFSVCVRSTDVSVLSLCLMYNHFHALAIANVRKQLSELINHACAWYAREFNQSVSQTGRLLKKNFGSAPKRDDKAVRTAINYVGNNPVEKRLCVCPEEYRWNFIAYGNSRHPFSEPLVLRNASRPLRRAVKEVDSMVQLNLPLKFAQLSRMFRRLSAKEAEQLVDYIISEYMFIDFEAAASYYGSYSKMVEAMRFNTGSEYDLHEEHDSCSDKAYQEMMDCIREVRPLHPVRTVISLSKDQKLELASLLRSRTSATPYQIFRFLHLTVAGK